MKLRFWKLDGAGNDFVLLDRVPKGRSVPALARALCDRKRGVGADGLIVMTGRRMRYWNSDGSAAFCGNGARCAAYWSGASKLETSRGALTARRTGPGRAEVSMPEPARLRLGLRLKAAGRVWPVHFAHTGVPHAVVFVPDVSKTDVRCVGRALRFHGAFGPEGANVNFVERRKNVLMIRSYERGVEDETLACGTGAVAAAAVARALGKAGERVKLQALGGVLVADLRRGASLEGPARLVFAGEISL